jgi:hypothetical protein
MADGWAWAHDMRIAQMKNVRGEFIRFAAAIAFGLLSVVSVGISISPAAAQTSREACTHDAFRLCSDTIPDVERTKACLARNRANLSPLCKVAFPSGGGRHGHRRHRRHH